MVKDGLVVQEFTASHVLRDGVSLETWIRNITSLDEHVGLFLQWCLVASWLLKNDTRVFEIWCDMSRLSVRPCSITGQYSPIPLTLSIGHNLLTYPFNGVLDCLDLTSPRDDTIPICDDEQDDQHILKYFTRFLHKECLIHRVQNFLSAWISVSPKRFHGFYNELFRVTGWLTWRCDDCRQWVDIMQSHIVPAHVSLMNDPDPYGLEVNENKKTAGVLSLPEWVRLLSACDNHGAVLRSSTDEMVGYAESIHEECLKILSHTTSQKLRRSLLSTLGVLSVTYGSDTETAVTEFKNWLISHVRFMPFRQIDFRRLFHALNRFRGSGTRDDIPPLHVFEKNPRMDVQCLIDLLYVFLEKHDVAFQRLAPLYDDDRWVFLTPSIVDHVKDQKTLKNVTTHQENKTHEKNMNKNKNIRVWSLSGAGLERHIHHLQTFHPMYRSLTNVIDE